MPKLNSTIPAAHLNIRGTTILAAFPDASFEDLSRADRAKNYTELQAAAARQDLQGDVVILWEDAQGRTRFIAPAEQHPFFQIVNYGQLRAQVNTTIRW